MVSLALHAAVIGALMWMSKANRSGPARDPGFIGTAPSESSRGLATQRPGPPTGPSLPPDRAAEYLGRFHVGDAHRLFTEVLVTLVNDGDIVRDHWSLVIQEGTLAPYKIIPVAADSFVQQLDRAARVVFIRHNGAVTGIEMDNRGRIRRGIKGLPASR